MTSAQLRAARALLRWDQSKLAEESSVSIETVKRLEKMDGELTTTRVATIRALQSAFEAAGVEFIPENGGGAGVRLRKGSGRSADHPKPIGPATDAVEAMDAAIEGDRGRQKK